MPDITDKVIDALHRSGLVLMETSARHVHLSAQDMAALFGAGQKLTPKRELSQPGQFLSEERVSVGGPKGRLDNVAVLGPERKQTQLELSRSDCVALGIAAPLRESGNIAGSAPFTIEGPRGQISVGQGAIIAKAHIHVTPAIAHILGLADGEIVMVEALSSRPLIYKDVLVRCSDNYRFRMHVDFDEANAACVSGFTLGRISKR